MTVRLGGGDGRRSTRLVAWPRMDAPRVIPGFPVLGVSYQPYRVALEGSPAAHAEADGKVIRVVSAVAVTANPLFYDGVLPRWHGPGFRIDIDGSPVGRSPTSACLEPRTSPTRRRSRPVRPGQAGEAALAARLLSLNLLLIDHDDVVVLIRRSDHVVYPRIFSGTVTGNCELSAREGMRADLDHDGLPDLLGAIARDRVAAAAGGPTGTAGQSGQPWRAGRRRHPPAAMDHRRPAALAERPAARTAGQARTLCEPPPALVIAVAPDRVARRSLTRAAQLPKVLVN
jgi:hypothetical protein